MLNVNFIGRLGADAEEKVSKAGNHFITMNVAVDGYLNGERTTDWVRVTYVGERALKMKEFFTKGKALYVSGQVKIDVYQAKTGNWVGAFDVIADRVDFVNTGGNQQQNGESAQKVTSAPAAQAKPEQKAAPAVTTAASVSEAVAKPTAADPFAGATDDLPF